MVYNLKRMRNVFGGSRLRVALAGYPPYSPATNDQKQKAMSAVSQHRFLLLLDGSFATDWWARAIYF